MLCLNYSHLISIMSLGTRYYHTNFPKLETDIQKIRESIQVCVVRVGFTFRVCGSLSWHQPGLLLNPSPSPSTQTLAKAVQAVPLVPLSSLFLPSGSHHSFLTSMPLLPFFSLQQATLDAQGKPYCSNPHKAAYLCIKAQLLSPNLFRPHIYSKCPLTLKKPIMFCHLFVCVSGNQVCVDAPVCPGMVTQERRQPTLNSCAGRAVPGGWGRLLSQTVNLQRPPTS